MHTFSHLQILFYFSAFKQINTWSAWEWEQRHHLYWCCCYQPSMYSTFLLCDECVAYLTFETSQKKNVSKFKKKKLERKRKEKPILLQICYSRCNSCITYERSFATFSSSFPFGWLNTRLLNIAHIITYSSTFRVCSCIVHSNLKKEKKN